MEQQNNDNRLQEFRQLKKEIRGSTQHLVVGIDIAKDSHNAFFGTPTGKTLLRGFVFDNSKGGFEKLTFQADILKTQQSLSKLVFGMEPTADYSPGRISHYPRSYGCARCRHCGQKEP